MCPSMIHHGGFHSYIDVHSMIVIALCALGPSNWLIRRTSLPVVAMMNFLYLLLGVSLRLPMNLYLVYSMFFHQIRLTLASSISTYHIRDIHLCNFMAISSSIKTCPSMSDATPSMNPLAMQWSSPRRSPQQNLTIIPKHVLKSYKKHCKPVCKFISC